VLYYLYRPMFLLSQCRFRLSNKIPNYSSLPNCEWNTSNNHSDIQTIISIPHICFRIVYSHHFHLFVTTIFHSGVVVHFRWCKMNIDCWQKIIIMRDLSDTISDVYFYSLHRSQNWRCCTRYHSTIRWGKTLHEDNFLHHHNYSVLLQTSFYLSIILISILKYWFNYYL